MYTRTRGISGLGALKRQQRRLEQVFVRIVKRHPALELSPAATHDEQPIAVDRGPALMWRGPVQGRCAKTKPRKSA